MPCRYLRPPKKKLNSILGLRIHYSLYTEGTPAILPSTQSMPRISPLLVTFSGVYHQESPGTRGQIVNPVLIGESMCEELLL